MVEPTQRSFIMKKTADAIVFDPMLPASALATLNPWTRASFRRRWERWEPWVLLYLRQNHLSLSLISQIREQHRAFLVRCLCRGVSKHNFVDILERGQIDDPRVAPEERERRLQKHLNQPTRKLRPVRRWSKLAERWQKGEAVPFPDQVDEC